MKHYVRIKHSVLIDIFARGLLSRREMRIAFVIIRESWGWDRGQSNWTKNPLTHQKIAEETGLNRSHVTETLRRMIQEEKILMNGDRKYSFNEHPATWRDVPKRDTPGCPETGHKTSQNGTSEKGPKRDIGRPKTGPKHVPKRDQRMSRNGTKTCPKTGHCKWWGFDVTVYNLNEIRERLQVPKEIFKEIFKETLKEIIQHLREDYEQKIGRKLRTFERTREAMIRARLNNFCLRELTQVVTNISESDWHMGREEKSTRAYNDFELLFRNDPQVEKYLALEGGRGGKHTAPSDESKFAGTGFAEIPRGAAKN